MAPNIGKLLCSTRRTSRDIYHVYPAGSIFMLTDVVSCNWWGEHRHAFKATLLLTDGFVGTYTFANTEIFFNLYEVYR